MRYQSLMLMVIFALTACVGFGQGGGVTFSGAAPRFVAAAVTGAPYSAEETQEHTQTLSDGTHITQQQMRRTTYRDSLGRTRVERPVLMSPRSDAPPAPTMVEITDVVAGQQYTWDTKNKIARRVTVQTQSAQSRAGALFATAPSGARLTSTLSAGPVAPPPANAEVNRPAYRRSEYTLEKLGTQVIEGVVAEGERQTRTIPEGEEGNDRPFSITTETWTSPDLKMVVLRKSSDPRSGDTIMKLTNISRSEPDASLFQPPPDYTVVDSN